jgi:hypothetical protein
MSVSPSGVQKTGSDTPGGDYLNLYTVGIDDISGSPVLGAPAPARLAVPAYSVPADAPQAGLTASGQPAPLSIRSAES